MGLCVSRGIDQGNLLPVPGEPNTPVTALRVSPLSEKLPLPTGNIDEIIAARTSENPSKSQSPTHIPFQPAPQQEQVPMKAASRSAATKGSEAAREYPATKDGRALTAEALAQINMRCSQQVAPQQVEPQQMEPQQVEPQSDNRSLEAHYNVESENIGTGTFGVVRKVIHKQTGLRGAVKIVKKEKVKNIEQLHQEVTNMWNLDHPNIVKLIDAFDDRHSVSLVLELCTGGELFHAISKARRFCEQDTAIIMDQMLHAVLHLHRLHIVHRDLKPENFLFLTTRPINSNVLKLIDFGLSISCSPEEELTEVVGTASYVAPQVLFRRYNNQCDLWSCGIIMYIMLCGHPPFRGRNQQELLLRVRDGGFVFDAKVWTKISPGAKQMISALLQKDPTKRYTAEQALTDPWLFAALPQREPLVEITPQIPTKVRSKSSKKSALRALAKRFPLEQASLLGDILRALDTDNDGMVSIHDLREGLMLSGAEERMLEDFADLAVAIDEEGVGYVDYYDVLAAINARANQSQVGNDSLKASMQPTRAAEMKSTPATKLAKTPGAHMRVNV